MAQIMALGYEAANKANALGRQKRRSFVALLFAAGDLGYVWENIPLYLLESN